MAAGGSGLSQGAATPCSGRSYRRFPSPGAATVQRRGHGLELNQIAVTAPKHRCYPPRIGAALLLFTSRL